MISEITSRLTALYAADLMHRTFTTSNSIGENVAFKLYLKMIPDKNNYAFLLGPADPFHRHPLKLSKDELFARTLRYELWQRGDGLIVSGPGKVHADLESALASIDSLLISENFERINNAEYRRRMIPPS